MAMMNFIVHALLRTHKCRSHISPVLERSTLHVLHKRALTTLHTPFSLKRKQETDTARPELAGVLSPVEKWIKPFLNILLSNHSGTKYSLNNLLVLFTPKTISAIAQVVLAGEHEPPQDVISQQPAATSYGDTL